MYIRITLEASKKPRNLYPWSEVSYVGLKILWRDVYKFVFCLLSNQRIIKAPRRINSSCYTKSAISSYISEGNLSISMICSYYTKSAISSCISEGNLQSPWSAVVIQSQLYPVAFQKETCQSPWSAVVTKSQLSPVAFQKGTCQSPWSAVVIQGQVSPVAFQKETCQSPLPAVQSILRLFIMTLLKWF